jgi:hypothetical protein
MAATSPKVMTLYKQSFSEIQAKFGNKPIPPGICILDTTHVTVCFSEGGKRYEELEIFDAVKIWDNTTTYLANKLVIRGTDLYLSKDTHVNQDPLLDTNEDHWVRVGKDEVTTPVGVRSFTHDQITASDVWIITHNLNTRNLATVRVFDDTGEEIEALPDWKTASVNRVNLRFSEPVTGRALVLA